MENSVSPRALPIYHFGPRPGDFVFADENCVALDCEMVGVGTSKVSVLARVSMVNYNGEKIFDTYVRVEETVIDYRTDVSGIRSPDLKSRDAMSYGQCRLIVQELLRGRVLVGHGLAKDLQVLNLFHPYYMIRDTSIYIPFMRRCHHNGLWKARRLAHLTKFYLGVAIQTGEHNSIEDAAAAMALYRLVKTDWDRWAQWSMNEYLH
jgi:RNA exonuclease 4